MKTNKEHWWRPIVSRATMAVFGLALLWGGVRCIGVANELRDDYQQRVAVGEMPRAGSGQHIRASGAGLPMLIGVVLITLGGGLVVLSLLSLHVMQKIGIGGTTLHDQPDVHVGHMHKF